MAKREIADVNFAWGDCLIREKSMSKNKDIQVAILE